MTTRYDAILNGTALSSIHPSIIVLDIQYAKPQIRTNTYTAARRQGARIYRRYTGRASVIVRFEIHAYDTQTRMAVCNAVQAWANKGGILQTSDRDGQRLQCICDDYPVIDSAMRWTDPMTVTFSAYEIPFWEEREPAQLSLTGSSGSGTMQVPGCVDEAPVEAEITAGGALTSVSLTVNGRTLSLSGISVSSGGKITISYDEHMIQSIMAGTTSLLGKRTGVDDLLAVCGESNAFSFTANVSCTVVFKVRGLWL